MSTVGVLFVCHGNLCRSPLAEGIFRHIVEGRGLLERFDIDSAGTYAASGHAPHPFSVDAARRLGIELGGRSRPIEPEDLTRFHHIIAMDRANQADILRLRRMSAFGPVVEGSRARVRLLRTISHPHARGDAQDVPDPIGLSPDTYATVCAIIEQACRALADELIVEAAP